MKWTWCCGSHTDRGQGGRDGQSGFPREGVPLPARRAWQELGRRKVPGEESSWDRREQLPAVQEEDGFKDMLGAQRSSWFSVSVRATCGTDGLKLLSIWPPYR